MSKAVLVIDMPSCCDECFALDDNGDYPFCLITQEQKGYTFRTREQKMDKCPLKPMLEKKEIPAFDHSIKAKSDNAFDVGAYMYSRGQLYGWNYCIEDLIGK